MQTENNLKIVVEDLFQQLQEDNVIYAELRFAPLLHVNRGLSAKHVVEIVADAVRTNIEKTSVDARIILCALRHFEEKQSLKTVELVKKYRESTPVVAFDLAADEAGFPIDNHVKAFQYAQMHDIPRTAHAGEAKGAKSVWETLEHFKPTRLGHGVRSIEDSNLIEHLVKQNIHLEICPTCNIQTDIYDQYVDHPVDFLLRQGVSVGINTDARTLVNVMLSEEYAKLVRYFGWGIEELKKCNLNAIEHAFLDETQKKSISKIISKSYNVKISQ
jgi:adenosine deaminase